MKYYVKILSIATLFSVAVLPAASAAPITFSAVLNGVSEAPPNASPGAGFAQVIFDPDAHTMRVQADFSGLIGMTTAAHIHCCTADVFTGTAGVATTTPTFPGFPAGVTGGSYDQTFNMLLASSYRPGFVTAEGTIAAAEAALFEAMVEGRTYFNIHTTFAPGGEIRGFLQVPEPMTMSILGIGLAALAIGRRRRINVHRSSLGS